MDDVDRVVFCGVGCVLIVACREDQGPIFGLDLVRVLTPHKVGHVQSMALGDPKQLVVMSAPVIC